jgi:hypothetical protein
MTVFMVVSGSLASGEPVHDVMSTTVVCWWSQRKVEL